MPKVYLVRHGMEDGVGGLTSFGRGEVTGAANAIVDDLAASGIVPTSVIVHFGIHRKHRESAREIVAQLGATLGVACDYLQPSWSDDDTAARERAAQPMLREVEALLMRATTPHVLVTSEPNVKAVLRRWGTVRTSVPTGGTIVLDPVAGGTVRVRWLRDE